MSQLQPEIIIRTARVQQVNGYMVRPPLWWPSYGNNVDEGNETTGEWDGVEQASGAMIPEDVPAWKDTFLTGDTGKDSDGIEFTVDTGDVYSDYKDPATPGCYALLAPDGTAGASYSFTEATSPVRGNKPLLGIIRRSQPIQSVNKDRTNSYMHINFFSGLNPDYRVVLRSGKAPALQFKSQVATANAWQTVGQLDAKFAFDSASAEWQNIQLRTMPNPDAGTFTVIFDGMGQITHAWRDQFGANIGIPETSKIFVEGYNFPSTVYFTERNATASVGSVSVKRKGPVVTSQAGVGDAVIIGNMTGGITGTYLANGQPNTGSNGETVTATLTQEDDGTVKADIEYERPTDRQSTLSDFVVYIPPVWSYAGVFQDFSTILATEYVEEFQVWDDSIRMGRTYGNIVATNFDWRYNNTIGHFSVDIYAGNAQRWARRCFGVAGFGANGISLHRADPERHMSCSFADKFQMLDRALGQEVVVDGLSNRKAVRLLLELAGIHPSYLRFIADDGFPPYPDNEFLPTLGKGTGLNPKWRFMPDQSIASAIMEIVADTGQVAVGALGNYTSIPYYFWFDADGMARFEPYSIVNRGIKKEFDTGNLGAWDTNVFGHVGLNQDISDLRTAITIQGQDSFTRELINYNIPLHNNALLTGWPIPAVERNSRYGSDAYVVSVGQTAAVQSSLPSQHIEFQAAFDPFFFAGDFFRFTDAEMGSQVYRCTQLNSVYGYNNGAVQCSSTIRGRSWMDTVPF